MQIYLIYLIYTLYIHRHRYDIVTAGKYAGKIYRLQQDSRTLAIGKGWAEFIPWNMKLSGDLVKVYKIMKHTDKVNAQSFQEEGIINWWAQVKGQRENGLKGS